MIQHLEGDCRDILATLPAQSIHCAVTSPPYFGLRSYLPIDHPMKSREIGQERTVQQYIDNLIAVFRQVSRVLMNDETLWLNLGDTYAKGSTKASRRAGVKPGELIGVPWRVALALQEDGWFLRSDIIWHKNNPKPEPVKNRPTKSHEYLFLFSKRENYYYDVDALREPVTSTGGASFGKQRHSTAGTGAQSRRLKSASERNHPLGKNKRSVWKIPVRSFPGAHFAVNVA
jgi:DNA modification methylase